MLAANAQAQQLAANAARAGEIETVVVTGTAFDPETAPAKASLETMEPQTIINKSYIEDSVSETADYTTILAIAPGMTGIDVNGPGLSDGGVKNTMRGLPDGSFGMNRGSDPKAIDVPVQNRQVLEALVTLTGQNFDYEQRAWPRWQPRSAEIAPAIPRTPTMPDPAPPWCRRSRHRRR